MLRIFLYGGSLQAVGTGGIISLVQERPFGIEQFGFLGASFFYLIAGTALFLPWRLGPSMAMIAWAPLLLAFPIGTLVAWAVIDDLSKWYASTPRRPARPYNVPWEPLLAQLFASEFGAHTKADGTPLSLRRDLKISEGEISRFLQNVHLDHGMPVTEADVDYIDSLEDLLRVVSGRIPAGRPPRG